MIQGCLLYTVVSGLECAVYCLMWNRVALGLLLLLLVAVAVVDIYWMMMMLLVGMFQGKQGRGRQNNSKIPKFRLYTPAGFSKLGP